MTRRRKQNIKLALVCAILGAIVLMTIFAPWLAPYDPLEVNMELRLLDPCRAHPLGTDDVGRDLLARLLCGGRVSLLIGLCSNGVHSNGFSLVRKALFEQAGYTVDTVLDELGGEKLGDVLLTPTKIYVKALSPLFKAGVVKGVAHITGGGFIENIPRMIPDGLAAHINLGSWPVLPIFDVLEKAGSIDHMEMFNIFNMGIGMVLAVSAEDADKTMELLKSNGEAGYVLGNIVKKTGEDVELQ